MSLLKAIVYDFLVGALLIASLSSASLLTPLSEAPNTKEETPLLNSERMPENVKVIRNSNETKSKAFRLWKQCKLFVDLLFLRIQTTSQ